MIKIIRSFKHFKPFAQFRFFSTNFRGLPFRISHEEASKIITGNTSIFEKVSKSTSLIVYKGNQIKEKLIPFHSANITGLTSSFSGEYGIDRLETYVYIVSNGKTSTPCVGVRTVTDWHRTSGTLKNIDYPFGIKNTQIYAGFKYQRNYIESVLANDQVRNIIRLTDGMLYDHNKRKRIVEPHTMNVAFALEKIINRLYKQEKTRAEEHILKYHRAQHSCVHHLDMHLNKCDIELFSFHLPAFIYQFGDQTSGTSTNIKLFKIVNGFTGTMQGDRIYSPLKSFLASSSLGIIVVPLFGGPASIPLLIGRAIIGGIITGTPVGLWAKFHHIRKANKANLKIEKEIKYNSIFQETVDDIKRKREADEFNEIYNEDEYESKFYEFSGYEDISLPEKYTILGLNPENKDKITKDELKKAYHDQIHRWHPDIYTGDKTLANEMTGQINEAFSILSKIYKSKNETS